MAHNLSFNNGRAEMAYAGETPWHGLGTKVEGLQTVADMLRQAGLEWTVSTQPLYSPDPVNGGYRPVSGRVEIKRDDTHVGLGIATDRYFPINNGKAGDVMEAVLTEGGAHVEVAGALGQGERCWMLAQLPDSFEAVPGDTIKPYILLAWGHDGKHGLALKATPIRVVCQNT